MLTLALDGFPAVANQLSLTALPHCDRPARSTGVPIWNQKTSTRNAANVMPVAFTGLYFTIRYSFSAKTMSLCPSTFKILDRQNCGPAAADLGCVSAGGTPAPQDRQHAISESYLTTSY